MHGERGVLVHRYVWFLTSVGRGSRLSFDVGWVEGVSEQKRHHFVPQVYLERFTERGVVSVRRRDGTTFTSGTLNVAVASGFYDLAESDGTTSKRVETFLGEVEGAAGHAFRAIDSTSAPPPPGSENRLALASYLAFQFTRTPEHRERVLFPESVRAFLDGRELTPQLMHDFLANRHLGFAPSPAETQGAFDFCSVALADPLPTTAQQSMAIMFESVEQIVPLLGSMNWSVEHDRKARLITSDSPLVVWRPPSPLDRYEGVGLANAEEVRFPLDPAKQLVLTRRNRSQSVRVPPERVQQCNQDMARGCHRFVLGPPSGGSRIGRLALRPHGPILRFNTAPGFSRGSNGEKVDIGEVLHMWVDRR